MEEGSRRDLVLVIDMQNAYLPGQVWGCPGFPRACGRIARLLDALEGSADPPAVCFTQFLADPAAEGVWAAYNEANREINADPWRNAITDALAPYARRYPLYHKSVYSSLAVPQVRRLAEEAERVVLTGVVSECCVLSTCMAAIDLGRRVVWLRDACAGIGPAEEAAVETALSGLAPLHLVFQETEEYLASAS